LEKTVREYYEEFAREGQALQNEQELELLGAARTGNAEKVNDLLSRNANISAMDSCKQTPLHLATAGNHGAVVKLLCDYGMDINSEKTHGKTPLILAVDSGNEVMVEMLIELGADVNLGSGGRTALYRVAERGNEKMVRFLIEQGADVNVRNSWEYNGTALHIAVTKGEGVTRALLQANADVDAKDLWDNTPLSYTIRRAHLWERPIFNEATTKLLLEAGATVEQRHWDAMPHEFREQNAKYAPTPSFSTVLLDW
jgi:ankyrin repeat protein